jgi:hypothetical protein
MKKMGAYDWSRDFKVGQEYRLKNGDRIKVIRIHENGGITAEIFGCYDIAGNPSHDYWNHQGQYIDYWTPSEKDISEEIKNGN